MNRRLTILMCADVVGYSALMGRDEALAVQSVRALKTKHLEPVAKSYGGEVLKRMGDGWILSFPGVEAALNCAEEVQNGLADHDVIKLRIGCHIGEIVEDEDDFYGNGVNIAQRIETEAPPGGLMLSEDLFRQLSETRRGELADAGVFRLKNITTPMRLYQWRPANLTSAPTAGVLPSIAIEAVSFAPNNDDTAALAADLHDGLIQQSMQRTGITTVDAAQEPSAQTVFLLKGRLRMARDRGRFTMMLMLREDMSTLWTGTYEGDTSDIFGFCDDVLKRAELDLRLQTISHDGDRLSHLSDDVLSVSELRARAANMFFRQTLDDWAAGYAALERAVALSPNDAMSLAMRAQNRMNKWAVDYGPPDPELAAWLWRDLNKAVTEKPKSDFVFWARGAFQLRMHGDIAAAKFDLARSLELNPNFMGAAELKAQIATLEYRFDDAIDAFSAYGRIGYDDPFKISRLAFTARVHLCAGNYEAAFRDASEAAYLTPNDRGLQLLLALSCKMMRDVNGLESARAAAIALEKKPCIHTGRMPMPEEFAWINEALHPNADPV